MTSGSRSSSACPSASTCARSSPSFFPASSIRASSIVVTTLGAAVATFIGSLLPLGSFASVDRLGSILWLRLAADLLASLDGEPDADADAAWAAEIERRARDAIANPDDDIRWETVHAELHADSTE